MPNITTAGTFTKDTAGFEFLTASRNLRSILFGTGTYGSSCVLQYLDDQGVAQTLEDGEITAKASIELTLNKHLQIVTTGSPNFNVTGSTL